MNEIFTNIQMQLKEELDEKRYEHTIGVMYTAACASSQARSTALRLFFAVGRTCAPEKKNTAAKPKSAK